MESSSSGHQNQRWIQTQQLKQQQQQTKRQNPKHHQYHHPPPAAVTVTSSSSSNQPKKPNDHKEEEREESVLFSSIVGTCPSMCPVEERLQRERLRDLSVFERLNGSPVKTSPNLAVKKFCRTISTKHVQASDVRPLHVLEETLNYLLNLLDSKEYPFEVVHDFIFDRTRSVRQDLSMQSIINDQVIQMFEKMVKFYVISHHKLRRSEGNSGAASSMHYLNMEQLTKTLTSLLNLYKANRNFQSAYDNEAEFRSLYVLLHLGHDRKPMGESLSLWLRHASPSTLKSKEMVFARKILRLYNLGNYKRFISSTAAESSYMQYCIIEPFISEVRALAVCCVNYVGYKLHPYPVADLSKFLMMEESDVESFCKDCGLKTAIDEFGERFLPTKQTSFCHPKGGLGSYNLVGLEIPAD